MNEYLEPGWFVDSDHSAVQEFSQGVRDSGAALSAKEKAIRLYQLVRDGVRYNPYKISELKADYRASAVLPKKYGYCVTKAILLAAVWRAAGIPARLGFADVKNHISSPRLIQAMKTDIFYFHGYVEAWIDDRWVKATPAFDKRLCDRAGIEVLEFDGVHDSIFHPYTSDGQKHMEYLHDYGTFPDLPYEKMKQIYLEKYPDVKIFAKGLKGEFIDEVSAK